MKPYWGLLPVLVLLIASPVLGATIHGTVYDLDLNTVQAVVEISTTPRQVMVAKNGTYSFNVAQGNYTISANYTKLLLATTESIIVNKEGDYILDLILFPDLSEEESLMNETLEVIEYDEPTAPKYWMWAFPVLILLAVVALLYWKKKKHPESKKESAKPADKSASPEKLEAKPAQKADLAEIIAFIKKEGGRTTQKDLRKAIPYSEAKISLMIAELESKGKVKKIKKGRGNIIILE
jgi:uncharacterized membrane protein